MSTDLMKAVRVHEPGGADQLRYEEVALPEPSKGQVRIRNRAIGLNFLEIYQRAGLYRRELPFVPGSECVGVIESVAEDAGDFKVGERVATESGLGTYAEFTTASADRVLRVPDGVSDELAAGALLQGLTAHYLACSTYPLKTGEVALVHAAAGGLGLLLVQIAKRRGARVIGTVSTNEKAAAAREMGADEVILYTTEDFEAKVRLLTHGVGVDVVYDSVGKTTFEKSLNCLKPRGYLVLCGQASGPVPPFDPQLLNRKGSLFLTRPTLASYTLTRGELTWRADELFGWIERGEVTVRVDRTFTLREAPSAHQYLEERRNIGKILLVP